MLRHFFKVIQQLFQHPVKRLQILRRDIFVRIFLYQPDDLTDFGGLQAALLCQNIAGAVTSRFSLFSTIPAAISSENVREISAGSRSQAAATSAN